MFPMQLCIVEQLEQKHQIDKSFLVCLVSSVFWYVIVVMSTVSSSFISGSNVNSETSSRCYVLSCVTVVYTWFHETAAGILSGSGSLGYINPIVVYPYQLQYESKLSNTNC